MVKSWIITFKWKPFYIRNFSSQFFVRLRQYIIHALSKGLNVPQLCIIYTLSKGLNVPPLCTVRLRQYIIHALSKELNVPPLCIVRLRQ